MEPAPVAPDPKPELGGPAAQVWAFTVLCGIVLGLTGAVVVGVTLIAVNGLDTDFFTAVMYLGIVVGGFGVGVGAIVGIVVGLALALLVRFGHRTLGPRAVARAIPVVAVSLTTLPFAVVALCVGAPAPVIGLVGLDAGFTAAGGVQVARYYLRRVEERHLH